MKKQSGVSIAGIALVIVVLGAAGGGFFGWKEFGRLNTELANTKGALQQARADARTAMNQAAAAQKELAEQKATFDQMRAERDAAKAFLDTERAHAARLQGELTLAREQIAQLRVRNSPPPQVAPPMAIQPRITGIRAAPAGRAVGAGSPAN